jgi:Fe-S-cluster containining protein
MEDKKEFRFQCINCGNCCTNKNTIVNVTYKDILLIKNGLKLTIDESLETLGFYVFEKPPTNEELKKMVVPPIKTEGGLAFVGLLKNNSGGCIFYDYENKRCKIYKLRPKFCRTFPFSFKIKLDKIDKEMKEIEISLTDKGQEFCEGFKEEFPPIQKDEWIQLGKETIESINDNKVLIEKWNEAVRSGKIEASARNFLLTVMNLDIKEDEN